MSLHVPFGQQAGTKINHDAFQQVQVGSRNKEKTLKNIQVMLKRFYSFLIVDDERFSHEVVDLKLHYDVDNDSDINRSRSKKKKEEEEEEEGERIKAGLP